MEYPDFPSESGFSFDEIYRLDGTVEVIERKLSPIRKQEDAVKFRKRKLPLGKKLKRRTGDKEESQKQKYTKEDEEKIHQKIQEQQQFLREQRLEERRREKELQKKERKLISMAKASENKIIAPNEMPMAFNFNEVKRNLPPNCVPITSKSLSKKVLPKSKPVKSPSKPTLKVIMPNANSPLIGAAETLVINTFDIKTDLQPVIPASNLDTKQPKKRRKLIEFENIFSKIIENMEMTLTRNIQDRFPYLF